MHLLKPMLFAFLLLALGLPVQADQLRVVSSFSVLGDFVRQIGGDRIQSIDLVGPDEDAHVYQPTPADARAVAEAHIVFINGLEFEGWLPRLISASGFTGPVIEAAEGIDVLPLEHEHEDGHAHDHDHGGYRNEGHGHNHDSDHDHDHDHGHGHGHGDTDDHGHDHTHEHAQAESADAGHEHGHHHGEHDPHVWHNPQHMHTYVENIITGLSAVDPAGAAEYARRGEAVRVLINDIDRQVRDIIEEIPAARRTIVTSHDAFGYFGSAYGLRFLAPTGISTEAEASAADVATLIRQIREDDIAAVFVENITDTRLIDQIARETGVRVGGVLYSDALSAAEGPASTWADMLLHNARTIAEALGTGD